MRYASDRPKHNRRVVNYDVRDQANETYTSQVAESHIETLINPTAALDLAFCLSPLSMRTIGAVMALWHPGD